MTRPRLLALDVARGLAVVAMIVFHLTWDLGHFHYIDPGIPFTSAFKLFGHAIAVTFLFVAGVSLALAHRVFRPRAYWRRLALIAGAALLVTAATAIAFPSSFVFFGILHCIAAASLVALPFLFLSAPAALVAGAALVAAPLVASGSFFDAPLWWWSGLSTFEPLTNDYRPLTPWAGVLLFGLGAAKLARWEAGAAPAATRPGAAMRGFGWLGRHSLALYLLHQPALFAGFSALALLLPQERPASFVEACVAQCVVSGARAETCRNACDCTAREIERQDALVGAASEAERRSRIDAVARACVSR
ncbi:MULTISPECIES: heparan-alpha-glucosaminide N-acetyltransferase [Methylosinus]|uniref:DUF1624 domain-containing protein n=1 Tax=Methylosinus trichosporium (strain ATCC 35070 / NCIMB 11131 / UNIQEM 75 / OB3b) TaxID=595536 RepID=A0A2D2D0B5_METT3|nr:MULTISPECIES: heparan-alpha-glucosaminide N-acetyltransferase [Methylosinus]ATQ68447.1 DUF1624 domain-containing protein [Methylosinus trichosporium OB3b]OBS51318.1 hypothetical protein A8B73_16635 [Methylosinus sp. 3S-1]